MSFDFQLKTLCGGCGSTSDLYGSNCKHMTLCYNCGKRMAQNRAKCFDCGTQITRLIREYNVRACSTSEKNYFVGRFVSGVPVFTKKKNADNRWALRKQGLVGRQVTDTLREKFKNKPWLLEDETGQFQYHGHLEGAQCASYYLLMMKGKEFVAIPAGSWYNFNKIAQYKQLTLEEAEEKIKNRKKTAEGFEIWMMKIANSGAAAFGEKEKDEKEAGGSRGGSKKANDDEDEGSVSDKGDEDEEEEAQRKSRLGLNKRDGDDDEEGPRGGDLDMDDDDIEKGDDWEHEEIFTDDDEAVGNDPEEREDLAPEVPAPPEIKQDEDDDDEANEEEGGGLSKSGKELKKLLGRSAGMNDSDAKDDNDEADDDMSMLSALAPKKKDTPKEEPVETPAKAAPSGSTRGTTSTTSKSTKSNKRASGDDGKVANSAPLKKVKTEMESKSSAKEGSASASLSAKASADPSTGCVTEEEIRAVLVQSAPLTTRELVAKFDGRLNSKEEKDAFGAILKQIAIVKRMHEFDGAICVVLKDK
ncbi:hypothetical protein MKW92_035719 [Papaver armeniacum]|nr:hypothetical protein MKW92_035719 [Papaver armeniacum]